jgi:hypothetical protein
MKPVTRLADVKAKHRNEPTWRELVIHDEMSLQHIAKTNLDVHKQHITVLPRPPAARPRR